MKNSQSQEEKMTMLSDGTIRQLLEEGAIQIEPFLDQNLQPASYDVRLGSEFIVYRSPTLWQRLVRVVNPRAYPVDVKAFSADRAIRISVPEGKPFVLLPRQLALGQTMEIIGVDASLACELGGKSSLARLGLIVHVTAGFIDPGNRLRITFEFYNLLDDPMLLWPGMKAGQVFFVPLDKPCLRPYGSAGLGSKYFGDMQVMPSRMHENFGLNGNSS